MPDPTVSASSAEPAPAEQTEPTAQPAPRASKAGRDLRSAITVGAILVAWVVVGLFFVPLMVVLLASIAAVGLNLFFNGATATEEDLRNAASHADH